MRLVPIVEGHGDVEAVPVLLRRLAEAAGRHIDVERPMRVPKGRLTRRVDCQRAVVMAAKRAGPGDAVSILLDADDDCPAELGPRLLEWMQAAVGPRRISVVVAKREFEAWFVASATELAAAGRLRPGTTPPADPEALSDPKGWLSEAKGSRYSEVLDQPRFAARFDLAAARQCRSFAKLERDIARLLAGA